MYFKLNIPQVNESISSYRSNKNDCLEDINYVYNGLKNTDSAWNDANSVSFINKVKKDSYEIHNYIYYLDSLYNEIETFKSNIDNVLSKYGYKRNSIYLKFDDTKINSCKNHLNNIVTLMNNSLNYINISDFNQNFSNINLIYNLRNEINRIKSNVLELLDDISLFSKKISNELIESRYRIKKISDYNLKINLTNYNWKLSYMNTSGIVKDTSVQKLNVQTNKIDNTVASDLKNNLNIQEKSASVTSIDNVLKKEMKNSHLNDNSVKSVLKTDIMFDSVDSKKVNDDIDSINLNYSKIGEIDKKIIDGLDKNIKGHSSNHQAIKFDENEVNGLTDNITFNNNVKENNIIFDSNLNNAGSNLNKNINEIKENNTNDFEFNAKLNDTLLSKSIKEVKVSDNNISLDNINNMNKLDDIKSFDVNSNGNSINFNSQNIQSLNNNIKKYTPEDSKVNIILDDI